MPEIQAIMRGTQQAVKTITEKKRDSRKAFEIAVRVEAFRQLRKLRAEIRSGTPGGHPYAASLLSKLAGYTKRGKLKKSQIPLNRLARLVRVNIENAGTEKMKISFGFVNTNRTRLSKSYKDILLANQEGIDVLYKGSREELGIRFARIGGRLKKQGNPDARFFFLRKTTGRKIDLPSRDIIDTYWKQNEMDAMKQIRRNYRLKMRGERI